MRLPSIFWIGWDWLVLPFALLGRLISWPYDWLHARRWGLAWGEPSITEAIRRDRAVRIPLPRADRPVPETSTNLRSEDSHRRSCPESGGSFE